MSEKKKKGSKPKLTEAQLLENYGEYLKPGEDISKVAYATLRKRKQIAGENFEEQRVKSLENSIAFDKIKRSEDLIDPSEYRPFQEATTAAEILATSRLFARAMKLEDIKPTESVVEFQFRVEVAWHGLLSNGGRACLLSLRTGKFSACGLKGKKGRIYGKEGWLIEDWITDAHERNFEDALKTVDIAGLPFIDSYLLKSYEDQVAERESAQAREQFDKTQRELLEDHADAKKAADKAERERPLGLFQSRIGSGGDK